MLHRVVINKCLCSRSQFLFLPESISSLDKLKSVSRKPTIKKTNKPALLKVAPKGKPMTRVHKKKKKTLKHITRENETLGLRVGEY